MIAVLLAMAVTVALAAQIVWYGNPFGDRPHFQDEGAHIQSPTYADNRVDEGFLKDDIFQDNLIKVCDHTSNGYKAVTRAGAGGWAQPEVKDADGAGGNCYVRGTGFNAVWHDTCTSDHHGCGPNSIHH